MRRYVALGCLVLLIAAIIHPWLFGLPGRIGSIIFQSNLHAGMTRREAEDLSTRTSGLSNPAGTDTPSRLTVMYDLTKTLCVRTGIEHYLTFDHTQHLLSWTDVSFATGC
jgi:hypothetical protein